MAGSVGPCCEEITNGGGTGRRIGVGGPESVCGGDGGLATDNVFRAGGGGGGPPLFDCEGKVGEFRNGDNPGILDCKEEVLAGRGGGCAFFVDGVVVISASISATASGPYAFST